MIFPVVYRYCPICEKALTRGGSGPPERTVQGHALEHRDNLRLVVFPARADHTSQPGREGAKEAPPTGQV